MVLQGRRNAQSNIRGRSATSSELGQAQPFAPGLVGGGSWSVVARIPALPRSTGTMALGCQLETIACHMVQPESRRRPFFCWGIPEQHQHGKGSVPVSP
jgi:hypothetical protein